MEHVRLRARTLHAAGNWLVITDCSNAFNTVKRRAVLAEVANCVPAFTPSVIKCSGARPSGVFLRMDSGETRTIACSSGVQQGGPTGPSMLCLALRPGLKHFGEELEGKESKPSRTWMVSLSALWGSRSTRLEYLPSSDES